MSEGQAIEPTETGEEGEEAPAEPDLIGINVALARRKLRTANAVLFDVDSTVIQDESIDEFAEYLGVGQEVAAITMRAMGGNLSFHEAMIERLAIMKPSKPLLRDFLVENPPRLTPGITKLISTFQRLDKEVYLVSGGFRQMLDPIAAMIGLSRDKIFANTLLFDAQGAFLGHDLEEPTAYTGGKATIARQLREKHGYKTIVMIGDGITDMEAAAVGGGADVFIGFGGNKLRPVVIAGADWFVTSFDELLDALEDHGPGEILDDTTDAFFQAWQELIQRWWLLTPFKNGFLKSGCMGALGLHLASRFDLGFAKHLASLGQEAGQPPPPPPAAGGGEPACEWVSDGSTELQLPELPDFPKEFRLPPVLPLPRLVPGGSQGGEGGLLLLSAAVESRAALIGAEPSARRASPRPQSAHQPAELTGASAPPRHADEMTAATATGGLVGLVAGSLLFGTLLFQRRRRAARAVEDGAAARGGVSRAALRRQPRQPKLTHTGTECEHTARAEAVMR